MLPIVGRALVGQQQTALCVPVGTLPTRLLKHVNRVVPTDTTKRLPLTPASSVILLASLVMGQAPLNV